MLGLSSRSGQRKEPTWTQAPSSSAQAEPVWREHNAAAYEPTQQQTTAPHKRSARRTWVSVILAVVGLLVVAYLLLNMVSVVQEQVARNQPQTSTGAHGMTLISTPVER